MIFNLLVFLMIVLITAYLATQGMLSSLLALVTAMFASILAMGLMEPLQGLTAMWRPESARGLTLLLVFLITFSICRIVADILVPKNIKVPVMINRVAGGVLGFFTALVVVGTIVAGIEMLPLSRDLLGYDRFPGETVMYDKEVPGEPSKRTSGVWLGPDRFVEAIWSASSGRALGGNYQWGMIHPDLAVESYGYRNVGAVGSTRTVVQANFGVLEAWESKDPKEYAALGIKTTDPDRPVVMVRTQVKSGSGGRGSSGAHSADGSADVPALGEESGGPYFRVTPTQVRLITDKGNQYYPIGYLEQGKSFVPLPLDTGRVVDDFVNGVATEDWIFQVKGDEKPAYIEMKELARTTLGDFVKNKPTTALASNQYPRKPYFKELSTLTVNVDLKGRKLREGMVYLLLPGAYLKDMASEVRSSQSHVESVLSNMQNGSGGWSTKGAPGVKDEQFFRTARSVGVNTGNAQNTEELQWTMVLPLFMAGQMEADGLRNVESYSDYFRNTLEPMWHKVSKGDAVVQAVPLDPSGKTELMKINPGRYTVVVTAKTEHAFFMWTEAPELKAASHPVVNFTAGPNATFSLDLESAPPATPAAPAEPAAPPAAPATPAATTPAP